MTEQPIWVLTSNDRTVSCTLEDNGDGRARLAIAIDGSPVALRTCRTRPEAVWYAAFLFERLSEVGCHPHVAPCSPLLQ